MTVFLILIGPISTRKRLSILPKQVMLDQYLKALNHRYNRHA